jgi:transmembrane sensor
MSDAPHASKPPHRLVQLMLDAQDGNSDALATYLRKHPDQQVAAQQLAALWHDIGTLDAPPLRIGARSDRSTLLRWLNARRVRPAAVALAATTLAILVGATYQIVPWATSGAVPVARYATQGEGRVIRLADGSLVTLATRSVVTAALGKDQRAITLEAGEAYFEVAHDTARPFIVASGQGQVRAVGTAFDVRQLASGAVVTVSEGVVRVSDADGRDGRQIVKGEQLRYSAGTGDRRLEIGAPQRVARTNETSWRDGFLSFDGMPLRDVIETVNRHAARRIDIRDATLGTMPIFATLRVGETDGLLAIIRDQAKLSPSAFNRAVHVQDHP